MLAFRIKAGGHGFEATALSLRLIRPGACIILIVHFFDGAVCPNAESAWSNKEHYL